MAGRLTPENVERTLKLATAKLENVVVTISKQCDGHIPKFSIPVPLPIRKGTMLTELFLMFDQSRFKDEEITDDYYQVTVTCSHGDNEGTDVLIVATFEK